MAVLRARSTCARWRNLILILAVLQALTLLAAGEQDHYAVLGLTREASAADIRRAFRRLSLKHHPDKGGDQSSFQAVNDAYEVLGDSDKRVVYDQFGGGEFQSRWEFEQAQATGQASDVVSGFYRDSDLVQVLGSHNFFESLNRRPMLVEFYAPWCVHCQHLTSAYKRAAALLEEIVPVGAVNCDQHHHVCAQQGISSYPTMMYIDLRKGISSIFQGDHSAEAIHEFVLRQRDDRVVVLHRRNFQARVLDSLSLWVVVFSAGDWCGPCSALKPVTRDVAYTLRDNARIGQVDCDAHPQLCEQQQVPHYPYLKIFRRGPKSGLQQLGQPLEMHGGGHFPAASLLNLLTRVLPPALQWRPGFDEEVFRDRMLEYYSKHNPGKVDRVDELIARYRGHEEDLVLRLEARYQEKFWESTQLADEL